MTSAASMKEILLTAYRARIRGDVEGVLANFADDVEFAFNSSGTGSSALDAPVKGKTALRPVMQDLIDSFVFTTWRQVSLIVEGDHAALHWRALIKFTQNGSAEEFDVVDLVTFRDGKIASLRQSTDTARIKALFGG